MDLQQKNFEMVLDSIYVYQYHVAQKNTTKHSTNNCSVEIYIYIYIYICKTL
jgi:hypothetical protein